MRFDSLRTRQYNRNHHRTAIVALLLAIIIVIRVIPLNHTSAQTQSPVNQQLTSQLENSKNYLDVKNGAPKPLIYAKNYLLIDATNGDELISKNADDLIPIASTTKMTTALTALSLMEPDTVATISKKPPLVQGSKINLLAGEKIKISELLKGLLIASGNDTAFAIAETYAKEPGNYSKFVEQMNKFVHDHGLTKSTYADPAGLDDESGRSTCRELAHIARLLLQNDQLAEIVKTPQATITSTDGGLTHTLDTTNRLIKSDSGFYMPDVIGVKTGFTLDAGHSLVAAYKFKDRVLIGVVMNTIESTNIASAQEMKKLLTWADNNVIEVSY